MCSMNFAAVQAVKVVQYTLDDFVEGKKMDEVICERLLLDQKILREPLITLFNTNYFGEVNPVCPHCGSAKHVKNGFRERHPKVSDFGEITVYVQRYECKRCGKGFSARIDGLVRKWHQYAQIFRERACAAAAILKCSGRKIQQLFLSWGGVAPSHQAIESWLCADIPELVYSGYYCYDEQVVWIKGKKAFRLTLFDAVVNVPVAEEISYKLNAKRVKAFLKKNLRGHPVYSITTDDRKWYREIIIKDLKAIHQLCGFHFLKRVTEDAEWYFKRKLSRAVKMRIALLVSSIREVFRTFTEEEFLEKLEKVYAMKDEAPLRIRKHIETLAKDVSLYTNHFLNPRISKTSNPVEEYYRQTDPRKMKKRYKTIPGLIRALQLKSIYWIVRNGRISEEKSLRIARQYLGRNYTRTTIHKVFSRKKIHFLKYWKKNPAI